MLSTAPSRLAPLPFHLRADDPVGLTAVWLKQPYQYGKFVCMKKTLNINEALLAEAREASGSTTDTDTVRLGLEALVRQAAYQRAAALIGSAKNFVAPSRRRDSPVAKRKAS